MARVTRFGRLVTETGLTITDFAELASVSRCLVSGLANGSRVCRPRPWIIARLANALEVSYEEMEAVVEEALEAA